jgi:hypothetical protein
MAGYAAAMSEPDPLNLDMGLDAIRQRATVRRTWAVGKIGNPQAWCRFCGAKVWGEYVMDYEAVEHVSDCPVPTSKGIENDLDAVIAEVERLRGRRGE